ncbi:MAG: hypothetical protein LDL33_03095 [Desulfomonile sp.]|nr:hypothetical protein [Desulfomonile sp.]
MINTRLLTLLCAVFLVAACLNCYADDLAAKVSALEEKAKRIQSLIDQAKASSADSLNNQVIGLRNSVDQLIKQRVMIDSQIAQLQTQMADMKSQAQTNLNRQIGSYAEDLEKIKSQLNGLIEEAKKQAQSSAQQPAAATTPESVAPKAPAAK